MKKTYRLGFFLSAIGAALLVVTIFRGMSPTQINFGTQIPPMSWTVPMEELWQPRSLKMEVIAESAIDMYILDENGITMWQQEEILSPLYTFNQTKLAIYTVNINKRGIYSFLFHNPSNSAVEVEMNITVYGFEQDLLWASIIITALGAITAISQKFIMPHLTRKNRL